MFCYFEEAESYAAREDEYLTAFYGLAGKQNECVGFKLKVVSRFVKTLRGWATPGDQGILVQFDPENVQIDIQFLMRAWLQAKLARSAKLGDAMRLMQRVEEKQFSRIVVPNEVLEPA